MACACARRLAGFAGGAGCTLNGFTWEGDGSDSLWTTYAGTYEEYNINAARHPVHIHVNPIQVIDDQDAWNQPGDWMDVVLSQGTYRQHLADHAGTVIVHCHWLTHEDLGCMSQFTIESCATDDVANGAYAARYKCDRRHLLVPSLPRSPLVSLLSRA